MTGSSTSVGRDPGTSRCDRRSDFTERSHSLLVQQRLKESQRLTLLLDDEDRDG